MVRIAFHYPPLPFFAKLKELSKQNAIINPKRRKVKDHLVPIKATTLAAS